MAEMREGDWECPDCGAHCFASRETCFKCEKKAAGGGGGGGGAGRREGDWDCPDCGAVIFASKDSCFKCDRKGASGGTGNAGRRDGDWDCPECGALVFASKDSCFRCDRAAAAGGGAVTGSKGAGAVTGSKAKGKGAAPSAATVAQAFKTLQGASPVFKEAWTSYCDLYGEGWYDAGEHQQTFLVELSGHLGQLLQKDLGGGSTSTGQQEAAAVTPAPAAQTAGTKRPAVTAAAVAAPPEKKKLTVKKSVADKIGALNKAGGLLVPLRLGAVAGALAQLGEEGALEALAMLEEQQADVEDPNEFLRSQAQMMASASP